MGGVQGWGLPCFPGCQRHQHYVHAGYVVLCKHLADDLAALSPPLTAEAQQDLLMPFKFISTLVLVTTTHPKVSLKAPRPSCAALA